MKNEFKKNVGYVVDHYMIVLEDETVFNCHHMLIDVILRSIRFEDPTIFNMLDIKNGISISWKDIHLLTIIDLNQKGPEKNHHEKKLPF